MPCTQHSLGMCKFSANGYFCPSSDDQPAPLGMKCKNDNLGSTSPVEQAASLSLGISFKIQLLSIYVKHVSGFLMIAFVPPITG